MQNNLTNTILECPPVHRILKKRQVERSNYIPHPTPSNANRRDWHNAYSQQLIDMYSIVIETITERYPNHNIKRITTPKVFQNLSRLIYYCSSKYITPYINLPWDEIEFKE